MKELQFDILTKKIQQRLLLPLPGIAVQQSMAPEGRSTAPAPPNALKAGVLILLYPKQKSLHTIFIQRTEYNGAHSGQISFPGGMYEEKDGNLQQTALRETYEEIGLEPNDIQILGTLSPLFVPISKIQVFPFVGYLNKERKIKIDNQEVEHVIEVQIEHLLHSDSIQKGEFSNSEKTAIAPYFKVENKKIWGATAMMLAEFLFVYSESQ
jgi:8-oxo-dGTP pyrophosphatase MutT (NUDIX family)